MFTISISESLSLVSARFSWTLIDSTGHRRYFGGLEAVGHWLLRNGILRPSEVRSGQEVRDEAAKLQDRLSVPVASRQVVSFSRGRFTVTAAPHRDWHLRDHARRVRVIDGNVVGYCASLRHALWMAVERSLQAASGRISYQHIDATMSDIARGLWRDIAVVSEVAEHGQSRRIIAANPLAAVPIVRKQRPAIVPPTDTFRLPPLILPQAEPALLAAVG